MIPGGKVCRLHEHAQVDGGLDVLGGGSAMLNVRDPLLEGEWLIGLHIFPDAPLAVGGASHPRTANVERTLRRAVEETALGAVSLDGERGEGIDESGFDDADGS